MERWRRGACRHALSKDARETVPMPSRLECGHSAAEGGILGNRSHTLPTLITVSRIVPEARGGRSCPYRCVSPLPLSVIWAAKWPQFIDDFAEAFGQAAVPFLIAPAGLRVDAGVHDGAASWWSGSGSRAW